MANTLGRLQAVGIGVEGTRGTATTTDYWLQVLDKDYDDRAEIITNTSATGVLAEDSDATITRQWSDGKIQGKVMLDSIGALITALAGQSPTTTTVSGVSTHVWTQANNVTNKSLTIVLKDANEDAACAGCMVDNAKFAWEVDKYFEYEAQFMGKKSTTATSTVAYTSETEFAPKHSVIKLAASQSGLGAASAINVRSASLTFAKNPEAKQNLGSVDVADVLNKSLKVTGTLEIYYDGDTYKDYVFDETERAVRLSVVNTDATVGASTNPSLTFDLYRVRFSDRERQRGNNDVVMETVNFTGLVDFSNSQNVYRIELVNAHAGTNY